MPRDIPRVRGSSRDVAIIAPASRSPRLCLVLVRLAGRIVPKSDRELADGVGSRAPLSLVAARQMSRTGEIHMVRRSFGAGVDGGCGSAASSRWDAESCTTPRMASACSPGAGIHAGRSARFREPHRRHNRDRRVSPSAAVQEAADPRAERVLTLWERNRATASARRRGPATRSTGSAPGGVAAAAARRAHGVSDFSLRR